MEAGDELSAGGPRQGMYVLLFFPVTPLLSLARKEPQKFVRIEGLMTADLWLV